MRAPIVGPGVLLAGVGLGGVVTVTTLLPEPVGLAAAIGVLCTGAFLLRPWAVRRGERDRDHRFFTTDDGAGATIGSGTVGTPGPVTGSDTGSGRPERRPWSCRPPRRHR